MLPIHTVSPGGYAWWYFDALSDDGTQALTVIFFVGSVFSPDYAARLRRGEPVRAEEHVAVNVALYERGRQRLWVMSEYGAAALGALADHGPRIGHSAVEPTADGLRLVLRERTAPFLGSLAGVGGRVEGEIELTRTAPAVEPVELAHRPERHCWQARMPRAVVRVRLRRPDVSFDGTGYHDVNAGEGRLERAFASWSWARFHDAGRTTILYGLHERGGANRGLIVEAPDATDASSDGGDADDGEPGRALVRPATLQPEGELVPAPWGLPLPSWFALEANGATWRCRTGRLLEATPFYARYVAALRRQAPGVPDRQLVGVGEHLDLDRFAQRGVQFLLRFKTRRNR